MVRSASSIANPVFPDFTESERAAIQEELHRILLSKHFKSSKRCPLFLRFIVERTLVDDTERIKERMLGIELFGRSPNYITADDPIVRVTAGEVRKRLARYYQDLAPGPQVQIYLPVGSYIPEFRLPAPESELRARVAVSEELRQAPVPTPMPTPRRPVELQAVPRPNRLSWLRRSRLHLTYGLVILLLLASLVTLLFRQRQASATAVAARASTPSPVVLDRLWEPILDFSGTLNLYSESVSVPPDNGRITLDKLPIADFETKADLMPESTAFAGMATFTYLMDHKKHFVLRVGQRADFQSFQNGPSIILGLSNDFWVRKATDQMRYVIVSSGKGVVSIQDREHAGHPLASVNTNTPYGAASDDYAIVGRVRDHDSGHWLLVATGIGDAGMLAAGRFLRNPQYSEGLLKTAHQQWGTDKNVEIILSAHVINGMGGPPQILTTVAW
jgi:hypothetical protein